MSGAVRYLCVREASHNDEHSSDALETHFVKISLPQKRDGYRHGGAVEHADRKRQPTTKVRAKHWENTFARATYGANFLG